MQSLDQKQDTHVTKDYDYNMMTTPKDKLSNDKKRTTPNDKKSDK